MKRALYKEGDILYFYDIDDELSGGIVLSVADGLYWRRQWTSYEMELVDGTTIAVSEKKLFMVDIDELCSL